jgi:hypothetical protein
MRSKKKSPKVTKEPSPKRIATTAQDEKDSSEARTFPGVLPDRDLKKNLGCG